MGVWGLGWGCVSRAVGGWFGAPSVAWLGFGLHRHPCPALYLPLESGAPSSAPGPIALPGLSPAPSGSPFPLMYESGKETLSLSRSLVDSGNDLLSRAVSSQVPSARGGLTSVFGMGTGGSLQPLSPEIVIKFSSSPFAWVRGSRLRVLPRASRLFRPSTLPSSVRRPLGLANLASASRPPHLQNHTGKV